MPALRVGDTSFPAGAYSVPASADGVPAKRFRPTFPCKEVRAGQPVKAPLVVGAALTGFCGQQLVLPGKILRMPVSWNRQSRPRPRRLG